MGNGNKEEEDGKDWWREWAGEKKWLEDELRGEGGERGCCYPTTSFGITHL